MIDSLTIRQYLPSDLGDLMRAWESANKLVHSFLADDFIAQIRQDIPTLYLPNADTWVAEIEDRVVGFIALIGNEVGALFVLPRFHGTGIGSALMNRATELHNCVEVEVFEENQIGLAFYRRYGFETVSQYVHVNTGNNILRMRFSSEERQHRFAELPLAGSANSNI